MKYNLNIAWQKWSDEGVDFNSKQMSEEDHNS